MIESGFLLWYLFLALTLAVVAFFVGRRSKESPMESAKAILEAANSKLEDAKGVYDIASAASRQSNTFSSVLDKQQAEAASLRAAIENLGAVYRAETASLEKNLGKYLSEVDILLQQLIQGMERSGFVRSPKATPGRQVGEAGPE